MTPRSPSRASSCPSQLRNLSTLGPIKIINAQCNMLPRIVNPTASDLTAHWGSCQNMAYDVKLCHAEDGTAAARLGRSSAGSSVLKAECSRRATAGNALTGSHSGWHSDALQSGIERMGIMPTDRPGSGGTVELNPQPFPPRQQLTNADVIRMVRAGITESVIVHSIQSATKQFDFSPAGMQTLGRRR